MDWTQWTANLVTTLITSTVVGAIIMWYLKRIHEKVDKQERDITTLKDSRVRQLEIKINEHLKDDQSQRIVTLLQTQEGALDQMRAQLDRDKRDASQWQSRIENKVGSIDAKIDAQGLYLGNLDKSFENHKNVYHSNPGRK